MNAKRRETAHRTLEELICVAEKTNAHGYFGVEVFVECGRITTVRRKYEATEK